MDFTSLVFMAIFTAILAYVWSFPAILLSIVSFGYIQLFHTKNVYLVEKKVKYASIKGDKLSGFIIGKWFVGLIYSKQEQQKDVSYAYILCTPKFYESLSQLAKAGLKEIYIDDKIAWDIQYPIRSLTFVNTPRQNQIGPINEIMGIFEAKGYVRVLLCGEPGKGKSSIAELLAMRLLAKYKNPSYCNTLNFLRPGHRFDDIYDKKGSDPIVIVLEEVDTLINTIMGISGQLIVNKFAFPFIMNKTDFNNFLDSFSHKGIYKGCILVMTSNTYRGQFSDQSLFREGRIDYYTEFR